MAEKEVSDEQPKTFACHHAAETCPACEGLVRRWKKAVSLKQITNLEEDLQDLTKEDKLFVNLFSAEALKQIHNPRGPDKTTAQAAYVPVAALTHALQVAKAAGVDLAGRANYFIARDDLQSAIMCAQAYDFELLVVSDAIWSTSSYEVSLTANEYCNLYGIVEMKAVNHG